ncbi:hypothetical protein DK26_15125 [Bosea sp. WAO]|nr:hypothetical protein DK26_15125 [Bosea sp. WAO]
MLRMPAYRRALADSTRESFLDLCEDYEVAWAGLDHCLRAASDNSDRHIAYEELIAELEAEVLNFISRH